MDQIKKIHNEVFVSNKIITYKVAAALLEISVNEAKMALKKYVNDIENKDETIHVSYVIGGVTVTDQNKVRIVSKNKYETAKTDFKTLTIDHIYSIQKPKLADWIYVFNVDDFLYDKNEVQADVKVKKEVLETDVKKEIKVAQPGKKGALTSFLNNTSNQKKTVNSKATVKKEAANVKSKNEKKPAITNFFAQGNKENQAKITKTTEEIKNEEDSDDDEIFKVSKKRTRVINDDDDNETPTKCAKVDILDDPQDEENDESFHSDEDLFGSPEKDEELMKDTEESTEKDSENTIPELKTETSEMDTETTEKSTDTTENSETMYEDTDGYFVTEKKPSKRSQKSPVKKFSKKDTELKKKIDKEDKKTKKEIAQKIKNNSNQKSILSFFQKK